MIVGHWKSRSGLSKQVRLICSKAAGFKLKEDLLLMQTNGDVNTTQI